MSQSVSRKFDEIEIFKDFVATFWNGLEMTLKTFLSLAIPLNLHCLDVTK